MKERPILFSGPMVRAILEGRKTVTRRAVKAQPHGAGTWVRQGDDWLFPNICPHLSIKCPYGQPGDRLWVRETWMDLRGTGVEHRPTPDSPLQRYAYGADSPPGSASDEARKDSGLKWRPSIHMPRAASRTLLEITAVRVERLQEISNEQAVAEGIGEPLDIRYAAQTDFRELWESLNGPGSWDANPWVWAVEFKIVTL